jgi:hypothetical protein
LLIVNRFPKLRELTLVYAVNVVMLYTFSLWFSFEDMSRNWILYLAGGDIVGVLAYIIIGAFVESLLMIIFLTLSYSLIPPSIARGRFVLYGAILSFTFLLALMLRDGTYVGVDDFLKTTNMVFIFFAVSALILALAAEWKQPIRAFIESFADRCAVFLYIYMPLSLLAIIVVIFRNMGQNQ